MLAREIVTIILDEKLPGVHQNGGAYVELLESNSGICHAFQKCLLILHFILHSALISLLYDAETTLLHRPQSYKNINWDPLLGCPMRLAQFFAVEQIQSLSGGLPKLRNIYIVP